MTPQEKSTHDESVDDDAEIMALEKILAEAEEEEKKAEQKNLLPAKAVEKQRPQLKEDSTFAEAFGYEVDNKLEKQIEKQVASKTVELDSSDDEEIKNFLERKYNEYGCDINKKLKEQKQAAKESKADYEIDKFLKEDKSNNNAAEGGKSLSMHIKNPHHPTKRQSLISDSFKKMPETKAAGNVSENKDRRSLPTNGASSSVYTDPVFGLRIINPLISSTLLIERMSGRKSVAFSAIAFHTERGDLSKDWVIAGVLVHKSPVQMSKKDQPYSIWRLSDLRGEIKTVSLFLFKGAHKELWKTAQGMCIAVLNPTIFEKRAESKDVACLSIDTAQKVMVLGQSKDMGNCKATKRNGEICNAIINLSECDCCIFHMKQEFGKMSKRSELQSANAGRGLNDLRNKVLGKSEVFYGGQSFSAVPARKSAKLTQKDNSRISSLSEYAVSPFAGSVNHASKPRALQASTVPYASREGPVSKIAGNVEASAKQRMKDLERLKILQAESEKHSTSLDGKNSPTPTTPQAQKTRESIFASSQTSTPCSNSKLAAPSISTPTISAIPDKFKNREFSFAGTSKSPQLSKDNFCIEVNVGDRRAQLAKMKALEVLKKKPIEKVNPNSTRGTRDGKRRAIDDLNEQFMSHESKKQKLEEEHKEQERKTRIQRIMDATSSHTNLVDMREREEQDKYFSKLEKKEALEEKMLNTYKMPCKAVICKICKYTALSASERCKAEGHPLKVVDAEKRFFQCKDCGNRTVSVFKLPKVSCKNCQGSRWERCGMIRERKVCDGSEALSLRGDEEMFIGSVSGKANLNLAVPDD
ncbi:protein MCM10 homolog [Lucilia cuprina]|uniref:protein MCM10 homolog n=1 Tax=Lucilia cuprina TaxID=7375 RepID=UPI001F05A168|nr:protein MCM10 homolog [Lucilia cuprina]